MFHIADFLCMTLVFIAVFLTGFSLLTAAKKRAVHGWLPFSLLLISSALYAGGYAGEIIQTTKEDVVFWLHIEYFGIPFIPLFWVMTVCEYADIRINKKILYVPLAIEALITFFAEHTNELHHFYYQSIDMVSAGTLTIGFFQHGSLYWFHIIFQQSATIIGSIILIQHAWSAPRLYKIQTILLTAGAAIPVIGNIFYLAGLSPYNLDLSPFLLAVNTTLIYLAIFVFGFLDISPIARMYIFDTIRDAVIVIDPKNRILDFNASARKMFTCLNEYSIGKSLFETFQSYPHLLSIIRKTSLSKDLIIESDGKKNCYELVFSPIVTGKENKGTTILFYDVTERVFLLNEVKRLAEIDTQTGALNRSRFFDIAGGECQRSSRMNTPFSILLVDIDSFKEINRTFGNQAGDDVLRITTSILKQSLRSIDVYARTAGNEFAILLPGTSTTGALTVAERIRHSIENAKVAGIKTSINFTASISIVCHHAVSRASVELMMSHAEKILAQAKMNGGNRIETAPVTEIQDRLS